MIKVLVVDDSALMRKHLGQILEEAGFKVCMARNGVEALQELHHFQPDVISLDINMPDMDGLTALSRIMVERPTPVVMVSSLTEKGAIATFEALALGAVDYLCKPGGTISLNIQQLRDEIVSKLRTASKARIRKTRGLAERIREENRRTNVDKRPASSATVTTSRGTMMARGKGLVVIGVSTGGPRTLEDILPNLPADFPWPVVIAQHMPANFTGAFARRMDALCRLQVVEVTRPMLLTQGMVYLGRGGADLVLSSRSSGIHVVSVPENNQYLWHPSVELLMRSALEHFRPTQLIGVLLTGMGYDGAEAMTELHRRGGWTIAESEETAVVYGMPAELVERGGANLVLPSHQVAIQLIGRLNG
ncbi:Protein-glutamate methylesterase/protein-glutamine glutaminase 3 [Gammaproteobacteria bacterium]